MLFLSISPIIGVNKSIQENQLKKQQPQQKFLIINERLHNQDPMKIESKDEKRVKKLSKRSSPWGKNSSFSLDSSTPSVIEQGDDSANHSPSESDDDNNQNCINTTIARRPHRISPIQKLEAGIQRTQPVLLIKNKRQ